MLERERCKKMKTKPTKKKLWITLICVILLCFFFLWQNNSLQTNYYTYSSNEIPANLDGYCIVQISDLHNKSFGTKSNRLIEEIKVLEPDMIVITGDIVDSNHTNVEVAIDFLEQAVTIAPCYYITGNHELWLEENIRAELMTKIAATGTMILDNEIIDIVVKDESTEKVEDTDTISLIGLDNGSLLGDTLHKLTKDVPKEQFVLLLAHEPQNFNFYSKENVDLVLCGHAHGGQVRLPFIGGIVAPDQGIFPEYTEGLHEENGVSMIISRGLGNSVIPVRIFNRPEIVCVELACE